MLGNGVVGASETRANRVEKVVVSPFPFSGSGPRCISGSQTITQINRKSEQSCSEITT